MKLLHLGDLHIGKRVHKHSMLEEQRFAFQQIIQLARDQQVDGVLIAGDVFDKVIPSNEALAVCEELYVGFLSAGIPVFVIPGNHDSAQQLSYCASIVEAAGLHIAGPYEGKIPTYKLEDEWGPVFVHLLPFVRPTDVRMALGMSSDEVKTHDDAVRVALENHSLDAGARNILVAHQFVVDGDCSPETSDEEAVSVGGIDSVQAGNFAAFDYVALGHLHGRQSMGRSEVRYCGSPVKYSFSEVNQVKSATVVTLDVNSVQVEEFPLEPLHGMREITASFDDLMAGSDAGNHEDYMRIVLTDESVYQAFDRLKVLYPHLLHLDWQKSLIEYQSSGPSLEEIKAKSKSELFADFFLAQVGRELGERELNLFNEILEEKGVAL